MARYDVLVIGSGPAGYYTALTCAEKGWRTAISESGDWGGTGLSTGCLPVKKLLDQVRILKEANLEIRGDEILERMMSHKDQVAGRERMILEQAGAELFQGTGSFKDSRTFTINGEDISADKIVIATGSEPFFYGIDSFDGPFLSHKEAVRLERAPDSMIIVGGDVEGVEFASLFASMGSKITIIEQLDFLLPGYDRDLVKPVRESLENCSINCSERVLEIYQNDEMAFVKTDKGVYKAEYVLVTGMRKPSIPQGLIDLDIAVGDGYIKVDDNCETTVPGIFAIGDINGRMGMGSAAVQQAIQLCDFFESGRPFEWDYTLLPRAVFTIPQICGAGMQEKDIPDGSGGRYKVYKSLLSDSWRKSTDKNTVEIVKVISDDQNRIKGIWFAGNRAEYLGQSASYIIKSGITISDLRRDLFIHPTEFESLFEALL